MLNAHVCSRKGGVGSLSFLGREMSWVVKGGFWRKQVGDLVAFDVHLVTVYGLPALD